nr:protein MEI2-like 4 isoform X1 [Tanacetum cinerariifolium]
MVLILESSIGVISTDANAMFQAPSQVPFPMGVNVRSRASKKRNISREENNRERSLDTGNGKVFSNRDSSSGSTKDLE